MAITELAREELGRLGAGLRGSYLVQQSGYTRGVAAEDGEALAALLPAGYLAEVAAASAQVEAAQGDRDLLASESKGLTSAQGEKMRALKVWRRKVAKRGARQKRLGRDVPEGLTAIGRAETVPALTSQVTTMLAELGTSLEQMGGAQSLLDEGKRLLEELSKADASQEVTRLAALPQKVQDYFVAKGSLYVGLKVINDAGHELFSDDPRQAAKYNLRILHRRHSTGATEVSAPAVA